MVANNNEKKKINIIGGGVGGLTVASRLASMDFEVTLFEKNDYCGGRCSRVSKDGFAWEQGAILYLFNDIYEETFAELGESIESHVEIIHYTDHHKVFHGNGKIFEYTTSMDKLLETIESFENSGSCQKKLISFLKECEKFRDIVYRLVFNATYDSYWDLFNLDLITLLPSIPLSSTMYEIVSKYFHSDEVRQALTFQALYFGISPFKGSGLFTVLPATELLRGIWYPKGGMVSVVNALEKIATQKYGVKIVHNSSVDKIEIDAGGKAIGVRLSNGTFYPSDAVISNADLTYTYNKLLPPTSYGGQLASVDNVPSTITFFWGLSRKLSQLKAQNIFLPKDYEKLFHEIHVSNIVPTDPAFYIHISNRMDPELAPEGKDSLTILVPVGAMANPEVNFEKIVLHTKEKIINSLQDRLGIKDFASLIETELVETPETWEIKYNSWKGSILGINHNLTNLLAFRPSQRSPFFKNLYFTGASTQPGAGVPVVMKSAQLLAPKIQSDLLDD